MFPLTAFTSETASRLTKLSVRQLHYWDKIGFFTPSFVDPNTRRPHSRLYSFQDIVGLRAIAKLRSAGITLQELRKVRVLFEPGVTDDWATRKFFTVGRRVFFTHEDAIVASKPFGQRVEPDILAMGPVVADVQSAIRDLHKRKRPEIGNVTRNRSVMGGVPVIAGTRVPTATVAWFHRKGFSTARILEEFPRLTEDDIKAALEFEETIEKDAARPDLVAS